MKERTITITVTLTRGMAVEPGRIQQALERMNASVERRVQEELRDYSGEHPFRTN